MIRFQTLGTIDLRDATGREIRPLLAQPKRTALLAYLALATPRGFQRRDRLLGLFWPELDQARARAALSLAVHRLRTTLGAETVISRGNEELGLDWERLSCDAADFERLLDAGDHRAALALYRGDLLPGFHLSRSSPELERWLDDERPRLRRRAAAAAWTLAESDEAAGNALGATHWARTAAARTPDDEGAVRRLIELLDRLGDHAGMAREYDDFARRMAAEFEMSPDTATHRLVDSIRERPPKIFAALTPYTSKEIGDEPAAPAAAAPTTDTSITHGDRRRVSRRAWGAAAALTLLVGALAGAAWRSSTARGATLLAVGDIATSGFPDSVASFPILLTTSLGRVATLNIVSEARVEEVRAYLRGGSEPRADMRRAAREAGAREVLEGVLARRPGGILRLDLRRVDVRTGAVRAAYAVESKDLYDLVDVATERIARDFGARPATSHESGTTSSLLAYRLYEEGLRAYYARDTVGARRFFDDALAEDSTFAMAALYASRVRLGDDRWRMIARARTLADNAPERERLLIRTEWAMLMQEPSSLALADSLATLYPHEPDGHLLLGRALVTHGDFLAAVPELKRTIAMDSLSLVGSPPRCRACEALSLLATVYAFADSFAAGERLGRDWLRRQPASANAWVTIYSALEAQGRIPEALDMLRSPPQAGLVTAESFTGPWIRAGNFDAVDSLWRAQLGAGGRDARREALWGQTISFRTQGRMREALVAARTYRELASRPPARPTAHLSEALLEGIVLFDIGQLRAAGALFDSIAAVSDAPSPGGRARHRVWHLTHAATAYAAVGDTARMRLLEDTIRVVGVRSSFGRDQRLHYYVHGLRLRAEGRNVEAVDAFRRAIYSPVEGYVRNSLELARTLLDLGRAAEAIPLLQAALRGPIGASGMYATRTELQALLGRSYEAIAQPDSAAMQYDRVLLAWRHADPEFRARRDSVERRVAMIRATH